MLFSLLIHMLVQVMFLDRQTNLNRIDSGQLRSVAP